MLEDEGDCDSRAVIVDSKDTNGEDDIVGDAVDDVQKDEEKVETTVNVEVKLYSEDVVTVPPSILFVDDGKLLYVEYIVDETEIVKTDDGDELKVETVL